MDLLSASLAFIDGLGAPEMLLIFVLVLVLFGGNKLPEFARGLGKTMREFKKTGVGSLSPKRLNQAKIQPTARMNCDSRWLI